MAALNGTVGKTEKSEKVYFQNGINDLGKDDRFADWRFRVPIRRFQRGVA